MANQYVRSSSHQKQSLLQHVHHPDRRQAGAKQVGTLGHDSSHQQSAIAATHDGQLVGAGVFLLDQPLRGGYKVVKDILFLKFGTGPVPGFAVLATAPQVGHGEDASHFHPLQPADRKPGLHGDVESPVSIQQRGSVAIELHVFAVGDEHRYSGAVFTVVENLLDDVIIWLELDGGAAEQPAFPGDQVVVVDAGWCGKTGKGIKRLQERNKNLQRTCKQRNFS